MGSKKFVASPTPSVRRAPLRSSGIHALATTRVFCIFFLISLLEPVGNPSAA